jgi:hypothetical protein
MKDKPTQTKIKELIEKRSKAREEEKAEGHLKYQEHYAEIIQDFKSLEAGSQECEEQGKC